MAQKKKTARVTAPKRTKKPPAKPRSNRKKTDPGDGAGNVAAANFAAIDMLPLERNDARTGTDIAALKQGFVNNLHYVQAKFPAVATRNDYYMALAYTVRDRLLHRWIHTAQTYYEQASRTVGYLSAEYLLGPHLGNCNGSA